MTTLFRLCAFLVCTHLWTSEAPCQLPSFPGAEGYGAVSAGGRGGKLLFVTRADDATVTGGAPATGTLRWAMTQPYPRIIVFRTAGAIQLSGTLAVSGTEFSRVTVAGQSAPGGGICVRGRVRILDADDIILRYLRFRSGEEGDALEIRDGHRIIVDHLSAGWGGDEQISIVSQRVNPDHVYLQDVTIQRCLMGECNVNHPTGSILGSGAGPEHFGSSNFLCAHHNLWLHSGHRFPNVGGDGDLKVINNVVYNWKSRLIRLNAGCRVDHLNNYYKAGPATGGITLLNRHKMLLDGNSTSLYTKGNLLFPDTRTQPQDNDWEDWTLYLAYEELAKDSPVPVEYQRAGWTPLEPCPIPITTESAAEAYISVMNDVGCNARVNALGQLVPNLDSIDTQYLQEVANDTGLQQYRDTSQANLSYPAPDPGTPYPDADNDGMSDPWEIRFFGSLDVVHYDDATKSESDGDGYPDLEEFLNGTNPHSIIDIWPDPTDSDLDFLPDDWEIEHAGNLTTLGYPEGIPSIDTDGDETPENLVDFDGDGFSDYRELGLGTSPVDPFDKLKIVTWEEVSASSFEVQWNSRPGASYQLEISQDLIIWEATGDIVTAFALTTTAPVSTAGLGDTRLFVRVRAR